MKIKTLVQKLQKLQITLGRDELDCRQFVLNSKSIRVHAQNDEVLFFAYDNYDSPIIFNRLNQVLKHFNN